MKKGKSHFRFNKQERSGIFFLLLIIILLQVLYFLLKVDAFGSANQSFKVDSDTQGQIDALKNQRSQKEEIYPFNPNFITDYKGYTLGMSPDEIDRLHNFRLQKKFVNSAMEFREVTLISDSLLKAISPYFKFPDWTQKRSKQFAVGSNSNMDGTNPSPLEGLAKDFKDLNNATSEDLRTIRGIGEKLSARIIKFRARLGGFLVKEQLFDVYGLEPEVVERVFKKFRVLEKPNIQKINLNTASAEEISRLIYIPHYLAIRIVEYREKAGRINAFDELTKIDDFPVGKIDRIKLYLTL